MKTPKPYRVKSAYGMYRKGDIIFPTGMLRDELIMCGRIEPVPEPAAHASAPEPTQVEDISDDEPDPVEDISDDEPDPLIETATLDEPATAELPRGRRGRHGR